MISTKGRYALRVLVDLAEQDGDRPVPLKEVAARQDISEKYLQHVAKLLVDKGLLVGTSGKGGGYRLAREPHDCTVAEVVEAAEGTLAPIACLAEGAPPCDRASGCKTLPMWMNYDKTMREFFGGITLADLVDGTIEL